MVYDGIFVIPHGECPSTVCSTPSSYRMQSHEINVWWLKTLERNILQDTPFRGLDQIHLSSNTSMLQWQMAKETASVKGTFASLGEIIMSTEPWSFWRVERGRCCWIKKRGVMQYYQPPNNALLCFWGENLSELPWCWCPQKWDPPA